MSAFVTGHRLSRGVPMPEPTRLELDGSNLVLTPPGVGANDPRPAGGNETVVPLRAVQSISLDLPNMDHCKYISIAFGMILGLGAGAYAGARAGRGTAAAATTAAGAASSFGAYTVCAQRQGTLTIQTQRDDVQIAVGGDQRDEVVGFFAEVRAGLKHGSMAANAAGLIGKQFGRR